MLADDPLEIDHGLGSRVDLSGNGFGLLGRPDTALNDGTPDLGALLDNPGMVTGQTRYRLDDTVRDGVSLGFPKDFTVTLNGVGSGNTLNPAMRAASGIA